MRAMTGNAITLGRLFGIEIRVDVSWVLIFLLVTWDLTSILPQFNAAWSTGTIWALAVLGALLFFLSVLTHELAHSLMARARGISVNSITLFLFGGVASIQREPDSAGSDFLITIVGPLSSMLLGVIFLVLGGVGNAQALLTGNGLVGVSALTAIAVWLGYINLILGVFNLIPGFPLDGGRILRAAVWAVTGSLRTATYWASRIGQAVGWAFIIAGIYMVLGGTVPFFGSGLLGGLWLGFIGWFLQSAARASYQQLAVQDQLHGVPVSWLMRTDVPIVAVDTTVADLVQHVALRSDAHSFPVMRGDQLVGMVTVEEVQRLPRDRWEMTRVDEIMTPQPLAVASVQEDAEQAFTALATRNVDALPVMNNGALVGMLLRRDVLRWLQLHQQSARG
ncbi:MAG TPA: site-2 protease family protein [Thermomicrobiaceae bacterium]|nr:site-2 protease family protein [Thermomicrobiaceae bacterium]